MKKLIFFLFLLFFIPINTFAVNLGTPLTAVDYVDSTNQSGNASISTWWNSDYYEAPFRLGYFTPATPEAYKMAFLWSNANLCSNQNLRISGYIGGLWNFFSENSYSFSVSNNNRSMTCSITQEDNSRLKYTCVGVGGGSLYISLQQNSFSSHNNYQIGVSRNQDVVCEVTNLEIMQQEIINTQNIINNQNQNTNAIIGSVAGSSSNIINNQNQNTQNIINNQNSNTDREIESQKVCSNNTYNYSSKNSSYTAGYLDSTGSIVSSSSWFTSDYVSLSTDNPTVSSIGNGYSGVSICFYNSSKSLISCSSVPNNISQDYTVPANSSFVRFSVRTSNSPDYVISTCVNGNQALNDSINNLNENITSDDSLSDNETSDILDDFNDNVASDTPITDLLTLPLTLINAYISGINSSCVSYNFGSLLGTNLIMPCINLEQRLGSNIWSIIDVLFSIFMIFNISKLFIGAFNKFTTLKDDFSNMYTNDYQPKHGGDD